MYYKRMILIELMDTLHMIEEDLLNVTNANIKQTPLSSMYYKRLILIELIAPFIQSKFSWISQKQI